MFKSKDNLVVVLQGLIKGLHIPVSTYTAKRCLLVHPDYPSLLAISECLDLWKVPHETFQTDKNDLSINEITFPFIAHFPAHGGSLVLVHQMDDGKVKYTDTQTHCKIMDEAEFVRRWDGIVLLAEQCDFWGEYNYKKAMTDGVLNDLRSPFLLAILMSCIVVLAIQKNLSSALLLLLGVKLIGTVISVLLLVHGVDSNKGYLKKICSLVNAGDCNAVLNSRASKLNSRLSWSEVGFFYFAGSFAASLINPSALIYAQWLNLACLPYTFYSIGHQFLKKNWCMLCCSIQLLLWTEAFIFYLSDNTVFLTGYRTIYVAEVLVYFLPFLLVVSVWAFIKPKIYDMATIPALKKQLRRFKSDADLFQQLLKKQPKYAVPDSLMPIVLGHENAQTVITMISSPFCGPCAKAHQYIDEWIKVHSDIQFRIIFSSPRQENDLRTVVSKHLTALVLKGDQMLTAQGLREWYGQANKNYAKWALKYPVKLTEDIKSIAECQHEWCRTADITVTPTYLINGYKLMDNYELDDIRYLFN